MTIAPSFDLPSQTILDTLNAHGVKAIHATDFRGPTITQHAFALEAGVKVAKVEALSKDLALSLGLDDVRIVAPIPGTNYVGIEVPRTERETVTYADFVSDDLYTSRTAKALPIPIGVGIGGDAIWADLAKLPHLLIAGATGSGKSVALSALIGSLIESRSPDDLRLWLVDPKRVELSVFANAPQVERVATDLVDTIELLETVRDIMDHRYEEFAVTGVRNIEEYNAEQCLDDQHLPYHVVVIDELADLMIQAKAEVEPTIVRIAQLARAAGIHLVLATQRPTVNVVTGLIAANIVSRWTFAVRSSTDSKVALEQTGAQALYGQGDSLWFPAGSTKPVRVQGVFADSNALDAIVKGALANYDHPETSASPRAASEDDDFDLADVGVPDLDQDLRDAWNSVPVEDLGGLEIEPEVAPDPKVLAALKNYATIDAVDMESGSNLEDPDTYNLVAQLQPIITDIVAHAMATERLREEPKVDRMDVWDRRWRRWAPLFAGMVAGNFAALWLGSRIFGA